MVLSAGGVCDTLLLFLTPSFCSQLFRSGSCFFVVVGVFVFLVYVLFFGLFVSFGPEFAPIMYARSYFQSHRVSLHFVARGDVWPGASTAAKGPRSQPVSRPLLTLLATLVHWLTKP